MRAHELTESLSSPYRFDTFHSDVQFGNKSGRKSKGMTAEFYTTDAEKYKIWAFKLGQTKAQRDKQKAEQEYWDDDFFIPDFGEFGGIWEVHFSKVDEVDIEANKIRYTNKITGSGDALRVFSTVMRFMEELKRYKEPHIVSIKSMLDEPSRSSLYERLAKRFAPQMGYTLVGSKTVGKKFRLELRLDAAF